MSYRLSPAPSFRDGVPLTAEELNALVKYARSLFDTTGQTILAYHGGRWGLFLRQVDGRNKRNSISGDTVHGLSIVLDSGRLIRAAGPIQASIPLEVGTYGIAETDDDKPDFEWSASSPPVVERRPEGIEWLAPVLHLGAEPTLWARATAAGERLAELFEVGRALRERLGRPVCAAWRAFHGRVVRNLGDAWTDPREALIDLDDLLVLSQELSAHEEGSPPETPPRGQACRDLLAEYDDRLQRLDNLLYAWRRLGDSREARLVKSPLKPGGLRLWVYEVASSRVRLRIRGVDERGARYGFSDRQMDSIAKLNTERLSENSEVTLRSGGCFLYVFAQQNAEVDVEDVEE